MYSWLYLISSSVIIPRYRQASDKQSELLSHPLDPLRGTAGFLSENQVPLLWSHRSGRSSHGSSLNRIDTRGSAAAQKRDAMPEQTLSPHTPARTKACPRRRFGTLPFSSATPPFVALATRTVPGPRRRRGRGRRHFKCNVEGCDEFFTSQKTFAEHKVQKHPLIPQPRFTCDVEGCHKSYILEESLKTHKNNKHSANPPRFKCDVKGCGYSHNEKYRVRTHKRKKHAPKRQKRDAIPEQTLSPRTPARIKVRPRRRVDLGAPSPHPFPSSSTPPLVASATRFVCDVGGCGRNHAKECYLNEHKRKKHCPNPRRFKCDVEGCGQAFTLKRSLKRHQARPHSQNPPCFVCDIEGCGKPFSDKYTMSKHKKEKHSPNPPRFECDVEGCGFFSVQKTSVTKHKMGKHGSSPPPTWSLKSTLPSGKKSRDRQVYIG